MPDRAVGVDDLAQSDFDVFTDTTNHTPPAGVTHWFAIRPIEGDITPTEIKTVAGSKLDLITLTKDVVYQGRFNDIKLAAGKIIAYRSNQ
ncbi:MAG: hypothetical protein JKY53_15055 [Flavobacteriales bacterium]|nr:hypothetical protein [Flavobacteriales bacterium]